MYQERLAVFLATFGSETVASIKPYDALSAVNIRKNWSANTSRKSLRALKRVYKWSQINGLIESNTLANLEMPPQEAQETVVTPEQMQQLEELLPEWRFKDLL